MNIKFRRFDYGKDLEKLFEYIMNEDNQMLISHGFQIHNLAMFECWITEKFAKNEYHDFFIIENGKGEDIGFTFSYDFFVFDGHCKFTLCLYEKYQSQGYGPLAAIKMMDYLLMKYPIKRIFISVFDYNQNSLKCNLKGGFTEVGCFPEYRYEGGYYFSLHILTITREEFYSRYTNIINRFKTKI